MASVINTNVSSLNAQRNLGASQKGLSTSLQRLSTGLRINSAKDDAAGLAISERMTSQVRGLNQAARNANDGISLAQTAEGALSQTTDLLQRMRELSVQSANDTNTSSDRQALQDEVTQISAEIDRIAKTTEFNGQRVIDGSFSGASFQVGANAGQTIDFTISSAKAASIGGIAELEGAVVTSATASDITIAIGSGSAQSITSSASFTTTTSGQDAQSAYAKAEAINDAGISGLTATAKTEVESTFGDFGGGNGGTTTDTYSLSLNGTAIFSSQSAGGSTELSAVEVRDQINSKSSETGIVASLTSGTVMKLTASDGRNITTVESGTGTYTTAGGNGLAADADITDSTAVLGKIKLSAADTITIGGTEAVLGYASDTIARDSNGVNTVNITTRDGAETAIKRVDSALAAISSSRSNLGAIQNRFESTVTNLQTTSENLSAARSRIRDADFAQETANLTKSQILQQAGTAMLSQANSLPQGVLSLLG